MRVRASFWPLVRETLLTEVLLNAPREDRNAGYFATALLSDANPDPIRAGWIILTLTEIEPFRVPVPLRWEGRPYEAAATLEDGTFLGATYAQTVRRLRPTEFDAIVQAAHREAGLQQDGASMDAVHGDMLTKPRRLHLVETTIRDPKLRLAVLEAYGYRCTILKYASYDPWTGSPALEACHILPVQYGGPDTVINALALERDVHWHFDRGLWTLSDNFEVIVSQQASPDFMRKLAVHNRAAVPRKASLRPAAEFLRFHRQNIFERWL